MHFESRNDIIFHYKIAYKIPLVSNYYSKENFPEIFKFLKIQENNLRKKQPSLRVENN